MMAHGGSLSEATIALLQILMQDDFALGSGKEATLPNFNVKEAAFIVSKN